MTQFITELIMLLKWVKDLMRENAIDFLLVPINDSFFCEEVFECNRRILRLSGFTGSAACLIVSLEGKSMFFTDGRYTEQAANEIDANEFVICNIAKERPHQWANNKGITLFYDSSLHTVADIDCYECNMEPLDRDLLARFFQEDNIVFDKVYSYGGSSLEKCQESALSVPYLIPDSSLVSWLLNIRSNSLQYTPLVPCHAILYPDGSVDLFCDLAVDILEAHVRLFPLTNLTMQLQKLENVALDPQLTSVKLAQSVALFIKVEDHLQMKCACKSNMEIKTAINTHLKDGIAMTKAMHWLYHNEFTEHSAEEKILAFRKEQEGFIGPSFKTISAFAANAAIIHYSVNSKDKIQAGNVFLVDSGGQYHGGTTDITRTVAVDNVSRTDIRESYTLVLKGHINLSRVVFRKGTTGKHLDVLARLPLWQKYKDYDHGTGHGVGNFLSVHEGPQSFGNDIILQENMIISNEPGYYSVGDYGIRIENLMYVKQSSHPDFLQFEVLTCAPINCDLVCFDMLMHEEREWLKQYNQLVYYKLEKYLAEDVKYWLKSFCGVL